MSDSEEDSLPNNVFTFQNDNTIISARGPNVNSTNITGISFRNNVLTSTMHMPYNFERQRYCGSNFDQRSMCYRRETSPMSLRSVPDYGAPSFSRSVYQNGMASQRSMYNGRAVSPMSVRSNDTTASSAADIVFALKNRKFNKYDLRVIKEAYQKLIKSTQRKRIEKRRKLKLFLKGTRRKSGDDSGEQGSDSSISSDDCRSVKTTICNENAPRSRKMRNISHFGMNMQRTMNHMRDVSPYNNDIRDIPIFMDRTENIKQHTLRNIIPITNSIPSFTTKERFNNTTVSHKNNQSTIKTQSTSIMTQQERFKKGFLLPSQRFNKTNSVQAQTNNKKTKNHGKNMLESSKPSVDNSSSDQEEIFNGFLDNQNDNQKIQRKRPLESKEVCHSNKKRNNSDSPKKIRSCEPPETLHKNSSNGNSDDFIFAKPKMPIKKDKMKKDNVPEKLLAKSRVPPIVDEIDFNFEQSNKKPSESKDIDDTQGDIMHSTGNVSMRPSFIKRKLFTQKLDVAEQKNVSSDNVAVNSPQNIYCASMRERNKARKLVTSQSCLSREITGEHNNVLDLIHKIVPPDQINNTNIAIVNKTESFNNKRDKDDNSDKWDVTTVIANCDNQDISDTYTDEEIFNNNNDKKIKESNKSIQNMKMPQCKIVAQKLVPKAVNKAMKSDKSVTREEEMKLVTKGPTKKSVTDCVKSFWDTDFESDMEFNAAPPLKHNQETIVQKRNLDVGKKHNESSKKVPISKGNILTVRNYHLSVSTNNKKSHKSPVRVDSEYIEISKPVVVEDKGSTNAGKTKETNPASHAGKNKDNVKENVPVTTKIVNTGSNIKENQSVDYVNPVNTKKVNKKLSKNESNSHNKKDIINNSPKNGNLRKKSPLKPKDCKNSEPKNTDIAKIKKSAQKSATKNAKDSVSNGRIQPKRKSKDNNIVQSPLKANTKEPIKTKRKILITENTSINSSTIMTRSRSRDKLFFNSSQSDNSNMNLSSISNTSLRLRARVQRSRN